jgi:putative membrane protein
MEGKAGMRSGKERVAIAIIVLFHLVGLIGFYVPALQPAFIKIVPFFILLMVGVICFSHQEFDAKFAIFIALVVLFGYGAEWKGVNKHTLFGDYSYGNTLGIKYDDVPLIIGFNWLLTTYAVGVFMRYIIEGYASMRIIGGALLMVFFDMLIEPVAVKFDYWHWHIGNSQLTAPISNFIDWFFVGLILLTAFELFQFKKQSRVGVVMFAAQVLFFILMRWA